MPIAAAPPPCPALPAAIQVIAQQAQARVGVALLPLDGPPARRKPIAFHGSDSFPTQSVYKLPIALAALATADRQKLAYDKPLRLIAADIATGTWANGVRDRFKAGKVDVPLQELVLEAVAHSDNSASDALMRFAGGPEAVQKHVAALGVAGFKVGTPIRGFDPAKNQATPIAAVTLLGLIANAGPVPGNARGVVFGAMQKTTTGPMRLPAGMPTGAKLAHKTGSGGAAATNDVGIVTLKDGRRFAIAVFVADCKTGEAGAERAIAAIGKAATACW